MNLVSALVGPGVSDLSAMSRLITVDPTLVQSNAAVVSEAALSWVGDSRLALQEMRVRWEAQNALLHARAETMAAAMHAGGLTLAETEAINTEVVVAALGQRR